MVDRLLDRGHPNKVSMRKEKKREIPREARGRGGIYAFGWGPDRRTKISEARVTASDSLGAWR